MSYLDTAVDSFARTIPSTSSVTLVVTNDKLVAFRARRAAASAAAVRLECEAASVQRSAPRAEGTTEVTVLVLAVRERNGEQRDL